MTIMIFSWGYWGWGNATGQLSRRADIAEQVCGFSKPVSVYTRLRRQGHAKGFVRNTFPQPLERSVQPTHRKSSISARTHITDIRL